MEKINTKDRFCLQQNVVSLHYRIIDDEDYRWFSTFDYNEAKEYLDELMLNNN